MTPEFITFQWCLIFLFLKKTKSQSVRNVKEKMLMYTSVKMARSLECAVLIGGSLLQTWREKLPPIPLL